MNKKLGGGANQIHRGNNQQLLVGRVYFYVITIYNVRTYARIR